MWRLEGGGEFVRPEGVLLRLALKPCLVEEVEKGQAERGMKAIRKSLVKALKANESLDVAEIVGAIAPDAAGNLERNEGVEGRKSDAAHLYEGV